MRLNYPSSPDARIEMPASISARSGRTGTGEVTQTEVARMSSYSSRCAAPRHLHGGHVACGPRTAITVLLTYLAGVVGGLAALPVWDFLRIRPLRE